MGPYQLVAVSAAETSPDTSGWMLMNGNTFQDVTFSVTPTDLTATTFASLNLAQLNVILPSGTYQFGGSLSPVGDTVDGIVVLITPLNDDLSIQLQDVNGNVLASDTLKAGQSVLQFSLPVPSASS
jgi:hypothetical protein